MALISNESSIDYLIQRKHPLNEPAKTARPSPVLTANRIKEIVEAGDHYIKELAVKTPQEFKRIGFH
jgi:hypothetical protein